MSIFCASRLPARSRSPPIVNSLTPESWIPSSLIKLLVGDSVRLWLLPVTPSANSTVVAPSSVSPSSDTLPSYFWKPDVLKLPLRSTPPSDVKFPTLEKPSNVAVCVKFSVRSFPEASTPLSNVAVIPSNSIGPVSVTLPEKSRDGVVSVSCDRF